MGLYMPKASCCLIYESRKMAHIHNMARLAMIKPIFKYNNRKPKLPIKAIHLSASTEFNSITI